MCQSNSTRVKSDSSPLTLANRSFVCNSILASTKVAIKINATVVGDINLVATSDGIDSITSQNNARLNAKTMDNVVLWIAIHERFRKKGNEISAK